MKKGESWGDFKCRNIHLEAKVTAGRRKKETAEVRKMRNGGASNLWGTERAKEQ